MLHRSKVSIQRNTNIQQANLTVQRLPSKYYGVSQETEGATHIFFHGYHPTMIYANAREMRMCEYSNNICRSPRKRG